MPEYKASPHFVKEITDRTVVGLFAIHGNIDDGGDRSHPGAFSDTTIQGRMRVRFLWQHIMAEPPTASINYIKEITRADLPPKVLDYAPDATGAAEISRTYLDTPRASEILNGIKAGAIDEMSYQYEAKQYAFTDDDAAGRTIRELQKLLLWDVSDVNHGLNPATVGSKGLPIEVEHQMALTAIAAYIERQKAFATLRTKEGRVLSGDNRKRIENALEALDGATKALNDLLTASEPAKTSGHADTNALRAAWARQQQRLRELGVTL